jgi:multimeric flavodoxin WrbA
MVDIKILGISGTPVKEGNCDTMVREALKAAEELSDSKLGRVETEFITLADKKIAMCRHCQWCMENRSPCNVKDDAQMVHDSIDKSDALILGAPTWTGTLSPPLLNLFSRMRYYAFFTHMMRNKVVAALTTGFLGFGLQRSVDIIDHIAEICYMLPVAEAQTLASSRAFGQRPAYLEHGVMDDTWGMMRVREAATRTVEITRMIKYATEAGVVLPGEYKRNIVGGKIRPPKEKVFVDGVWRER